MAISSIITKYLTRNSAMDAAVWEETKHHRSDDGRFASGTGRGANKKDADDKTKGDKDKDKEREEMSEEQASKIVRSAFEEAKCDLKGIKLVNHALNANVNEADEGTLDAINKYLTERGLKAKIADKTTFKIAEDGYDDIQVVDDPMLEVLVDLCMIDMLAKDLHYRAQGKAFYGIHQLSDLVKEIADSADDLNEVYYMGEKGEEPPERSYVAAKAAELVGNAGGEDSLLKALAEACASAARAVEDVKKNGVASGTAAVLDDISKRALQAKGLLARTMKSMDNGRTIDAIVAKGIAFKPEVAAQDSGTHEGAIKAEQTRKAHGIGYAGLGSKIGNQKVALTTFRPDVGWQHSVHPNGQSVESHLSKSDKPLEYYHVSDYSHHDFSHPKSLIAFGGKGGYWDNFSKNNAGINRYRHEPAQDSGTSEGAKKAWLTRMGAGHRENTIQGNGDYTPSNGQRAYEGRNVMIGGNGTNIVRQPIGRWEKGKGY